MEEISVDDVITGWSCCSLKEYRFCHQCPYQSLKNKNDIYKCSMVLATDVNRLVYEKRISLYAISGGGTVAVKKTKEES